MVLELLLLLCSQCFFGPFFNSMNQHVAMSLAYLVLPEFVFAFWSDWEDDGA